MSTKPTGIRIVQNANIISIQKIAPPDQAGNQHWITIATINLDDWINRGDGNYKPAKDCTDWEIIKAVITAE